MKEIKTKLKILESDIRKIKRKIKQFKRAGNFSQISWRKKLLTKLQKKATMTYELLEQWNKVRRLYE